MSEDQDIMNRIEIAVDIEHDRYPYSLVWTALPCLTCCIPCIGHTGICKSDGTIFDFVGRGPMHSGEMAFGAPLKYVILDHSSYTEEDWDNAIDIVNKQYEKTDHNLIVHNCHHHVAAVLNQLKYQNKNDWGQVDIALLALRGKHTKLIAFLIYAIFLIIAFLVLIKIM